MSRCHPWRGGGVGTVSLLLDPVEQSCKTKCNNSPGQTRRAPLQIATLMVHINRCEADPILTKSPTWQQDNNSKLLVAGFCLCRGKKIGLPYASESFALLRNLINTVQ